jgi:glycosyltransferase involved in cell wall biosynthesis
MGEPEGIDLLLRSIAHLVHTLHRTDIQFTLVGSGPLTEQLKQMAIDLHIADWVTFTGRLPDAEMLAVLSTADLCVNPDRKNDYNDLCTMNKILEYMALGKAVVQFDLIEGRRSAEDASVYAKGNDIEDFARCIVDLLADPDRRAAMGAIGRRRLADQLEWRHQKKILLEAVARLFPGRAPA